MRSLENAGLTPADINWDPEKNGPIDPTQTPEYRQVNKNSRPKNKTSQNAKTIALGDDPSANAARIIDLKGPDYAATLARAIFLDDRVIQTKTL
jgi:hypothetical protein